jgi:hypothetical protein
VVLQAYLNRLVRQDFQVQLEKLQAEGLSEETAAEKGMQLENHCVSYYRSLSNKSIDSFLCNYFDRITTLES